MMSQIVDWYCLAVTGAMFIFLLGRRWKTWKKAVITAPGGQEFAKLDYPSDLFAIGLEEGLDFLDTLPRDKMMECGVAKFNNGYAIRGKRKRTLGMFVVSFMASAPAVNAAIPARIPVPTDERDGEANRGCIYMFVVGLIYVAYTIYMMFCARCVTAFLRRKAREIERLDDDDPMKIALENAKYALGLSVHAEGATKVGSLFYDAALVWIEINCPGIRKFLLTFVYYVFLVWLEVDPIGMLPDHYTDYILWHPQMSYIGLAFAFHFCYEPATVIVEYLISDKPWWFVWRLEEYIQAYRRRQLYSKMQEQDRLTRENIIKQELDNEITELKIRLDVVDAADRTHAEESADMMSTSTCSTVETNSILDMDIEFETNDLDTKGPLHTLLTLNVPKAIAMYVGALFCAPKYSDNKSACIAYHTTALMALMTTVNSLRGGAIVDTIDSMFGAQIFGQSGTEAASPQWVEDIASSIDAVKDIENSTVNSTIESFFTFVITLPVLFSKIYSAESYRDIWNMVKKAIKHGGTSMVTMLRSLVSLHANVMTIRDFSGAAALLKNLVCGSTIDAEMHECRKLMREIRLGTKKLHISEQEAIRLRFLKLEKACAARLKDNRATPFEISRAKEAYDIVAKYSAYVASTGLKLPPYIDSYYSEASGIGKSTFMETLSSLKHKWRDMEDVQRVNQYRLDLNFQTVTNATTEITLDDQAQIKPELRKQSFAAALFPLSGVMCETIDSPIAEEKGQHFYLHTFVTIIDNSETRGIEREVTCKMAGLRRLGDKSEIRIIKDYANARGGLKTMNEDGTPVELDVYGSHLEFCPYDYRLDEGSDVPVRYNIFESNGKQGWISNVEFLKYKRDRIVDHFAQCDRMFEKAKIMKNELLCNQCQVLPSSLCQCGQAFMDANAEAGVVETIKTVMPRNPGVEGIQKVFFHIACCLAMTMHYYSATGRFVYWFVTTRFLEVFVCVLAFFAVPEFVMYGYTGTEYLFVTFGTLVCYCLFRVRSYLFSVRNVRLEKLLSLYYGNVESFPEWLSMFSKGIDYKKLASQLLTAMALALMAKQMWVKLYSVFISQIDGENTQEMACRTRGVVASLFKPSANAEAAPQFEKIAASPPPENQWQVPTRRKVECLRPPHTISGPDFSRIIRSNIVPVTIRPKGGLETNVYLLMIDSFIGITVAHAVVDDDCVVTDLEICYGKKTVHVAAEHVLIQSKRDIAAIYFSGAVFDSKKPISAYFPQDVKRGTHTVEHLYYHGGDPFSAKFEATENNVSYKCLTNRGHREPSNDFAYTANRTWASEVGYCGTPYISTSSPFLIMGIHAAGAKPFLRSPFSVFLPVLFQDIEVFQRHFEKNTTYQVPLRREGKLDRLSGNQKSEREELCPKHPINFITPSEDRVLAYDSYTDKNYTPISNLRYNPHLATAMLHLNLKPIIAKPLMRWRHSVHPVIDKATEIRAPVFSKYIDTAVKLLCKRDRREATYFKDKFPHLCKPLSYHDALNGLSPIPAMSLNTASGIGGKKSRYVTGEHPNRELVPEMAVDCARVEGALREGRDPMHIFEAAMKDELKKDGKIPRQFFITQMQCHVPTVRYGRPIIEVMNQNPVGFNTAIGMNKNGEKWVEAMSQFVQPEFREYNFDTDFSDFDKRINWPVRSGFYKRMLAIAETIGYSQEDCDMLEAIFKTLNDPLVDVGGARVYLSLLWVSGTIFTSHGDGAMQEILAVTDYVRYCDENNRDPEDWESHVRLLSLGDDGINARSKSLVESGWTIEHLIETCADLGFTMTAADKQEGVRFKRLEECEFLKSYIHFHSDLKLNINAMSPKSYLKPFIGFMPPEDGDLEAYYCDMTKNAMMEAFFGGRGSFDEMLKRFESYYSAINYARPSVLDKPYEDWVDEFRPTVEQEPIVESRDIGVELLAQYDSIQKDSWAAALRDLEVFAESEIVSEETMEGIAQLDAPAQEVSQARYDATPEWKRLPIAPKTELAEVLSRRFLIFEREFGPGQFLPIPLQPYTALSNQRNIKQKLNFYAYMRAGIKLEIELTAPPTMAAMFIFSVVHFPENLSDNVFTQTGMDNICSLSQKQHVIAKLPSETGLFTLEIPYVFPTPMLPPFSKAFDSMTQVFGMPVVDPVSSMGSPTCKMRIYASYMDLVLTGATGLSIPTEPFAEAGGEKISRMLESAAKIGDAISDIPGMSSVRMASDIARTAGGLAHYAGFAKAEGETGVVPSTQNNMPNANGSGVVHNLSVLNNQETLPSGACVGIHEDEMLFSKFLRTWSMIARIPVSTTTTSETKIWHFNVTPSVFVSGGNGVLQPASMAAVPLWMEFWRGDVELKIEAVLPLNSSGRLRVQYDPFTDAQVSIKSQTEPGEDNREHVIIDLAKNTTAIIRVGYSSNMGALHCLPVVGDTPGTRTTLGEYGVLGVTPPYRHPAADTSRLGSHYLLPEQGSPLSHNGKLEFFVHSPFQNGSGVEMPATIVISARMAEGAEFFKYRGGMVPGVVATPKHHAEDLRFPGPISAPGDRNPTTCVAGTEIGPLCQSGPVFLTPEKETNAPSAAPSTLPPTTLQPTPLPSVKPTTLSPTTVLPAAPTDPPFIMATATPTSLSGAGSLLRGAPGLVCGFESLSASMYWFQDVNSLEATSAWRVTGDSTFSVIDTEDGDTREAGISMRLVSGTCTVNGVVPPIDTTTVLYTWTGQDKLDIVVSGTDFDLRFYSGSRRLENSKGFRSKPPPSNTGFVRSIVEISPDVAAYQSHDFVDMEMTDCIPDEREIATVTYTGTISYRPYGGDEFVLPGNEGMWTRREIPNVPMYMRTIGPESFIYSVTYVTAAPNSQENHPNTVRRKLLGWTPFAEGEVAIAQQDEPLTFVFGSTQSCGDYVAKVLSGETILSFRTLLKQPVLINDYILNAPSPNVHYETTLFSEMYMDGDHDTQISSLWIFLMLSYNGLRGGINSTYQVMGSGSLAVSCENTMRVGSLNGLGPGTAIADSRLNPVITVKFPCQRNVDYTFAAHEPGPESFKKLTISGWGPSVRVKEWRSISEDFCFLIFKGASSIQVVPDSAFP